MPIKRGCLIALVTSVLGIAALVTAYNYFYPTYTYRYRLTANIELEGKIYSGSSVIEVTWSKHPEIPDVGSFTPKLRGQAALVDLGSHGAVVATLTNGESYGPAKDGAWGALGLVPRAFGVKDSNDGLPDLPKLLGKRALVPNNLPRFLWFSDAKDPTTAQKVLVQDFSSILGPSVRFAGASVEITNDPLVVDIRNKLPWLKPLEQRPPGKHTIYPPNGLEITPYLFVGD
jgi:hypothetical protein